MKPTIIIDSHIPFIKGVLDSVANVRYLNGNEINAETIRGADALIVRTRTRCDEALLQGSPVKYIATATIGFDHIDVDYCRKVGITWANAPGCNAASVQQYVASALCFLRQKALIDFSRSSVGIVGVGNVGKLVAKFCETLGMRVLLNDPPRERAEKNNMFVPLANIAHECDIITFHVPLNIGGRDNTFHLADDAFFSSLKRKPIVFNTARGEVFDTEVLKKARLAKQVSGIVLDCWEHEPLVDAELLSMCDIGTPHIAGYSADGKANATTVCVHFVSRCFGLGLENWQVMEIPKPEQPIIDLRNDIQSTEKTLTSAILHSYNAERDSIGLKNSPTHFEGFRNNYPIRREFPAFTVQLSEGHENEKKQLGAIGFKVE